MGPLDATIASLQHEIATCELQLQRLKAQLADAESRAAAAPDTTDLRTITIASSSNGGAAGSSNSNCTNDTSLHSGLYGDPAPAQLLETAIDGGFPVEWQGETMAALARYAEARKKWPLEADEYKRYGRQLIMPEIGLQGQLRLKAAAVLIVGAGGLGCPAAAYLAGAGVGTLGIVDGDTVEESNLHRQILHSSSKVGLGKVDSALLYLRSLNPNVKYQSHRHRLAAENALDVFSGYDLVLDCTDTPASRYLISDTCVLLNKPLVSASALRTEGQLMVLNNPPRAPGDATGGPCYRCVFPKPPPAESVVSCGEGGILGPVVGVMGVLQALEAIKLIAAGLETQVPLSHSSPMDIDDEASQAESNRTPVKEHVPGSNNKPSLLLFSAYGSPQFRSFGLRSRKPKCAACSAQATVTREALASGSMDYVQFCGAASPINALAPEERIRATQYHETREAEADAYAPDAERRRLERHVLVDVRERVQFELGHLDGSINVPYSDVAALTVSAPSTPGAFQTPRDGEEAPGLQEQPPWLANLRRLSPSQPIVVTCRLGNDSQLTVRKFQRLGLDEGGKRKIVDIVGGLKAWRQDVDETFPDY